MMKDLREKKGIFLVVGAGALWGTTGTITKYIYAYDLDSLTLALLRIGVSFFALFFIALITGKLTKPKKLDLLLFLSFGAVSVAAFNLLYLSAIRLTTVTTAVVLLYTAPAFSLIAARLFLQESLGKEKILLLLITFIGILLVMQIHRPGQLFLNIPGVLSGLGAGLTYGVYSIFSKSALKRGYSPLSVVVFALGSGTLWLSIVNPPWYLLRLYNAPLELWGLIALVSVVSTVLAYIFFVQGLAHVEAGRATLLASVEPVVAIILAAILLGERMNSLQYVGVTFVLAAVYLQGKAP